ncbi:T1SS secreted agglutinin RTX [Acinetobacter sp. neg1]|uniref:Ig-like domain-containing protein n=1 Tax=Acinetobacter sp. neg1 TaxID=1561068 RepID=UPI0005428AF9|nr:Ig-like domain-containing protein [Acinetobacter sp. neg1]KHF78792.1 T1SS secreted agglutinin RTX [Acinetobacter sp. neg1]
MSEKKFLTKAKAKASQQTLTIENPNSNILGAVHTNENSKYTVDIKSPSTNTEVLNVTAKEAIGNKTEPTQTITRDTKAPDAPTANVAKDGTQVTGIAEPGSNVEIKDTVGKVIGSGVADAAGNYKVILTPAQNEGQPLSVTATDKAGNTSTSTNILAPNLDRVEAFDVSGQANISTIEPISKHTVDSKGDEISFNSFVNALDLEKIVNLLTGTIGSVVQFVTGGTDNSSGYPVLPTSQSYDFEVRENQTADVKIDFGTKLIGGLTNGVSLLRNIGGDNWEVVSNKTAFGVGVKVPFTKFGLGGPSGSLLVNDLPPGQYKVVMSTKVGIGVTSESKANVSIDYSNYLVNDNGNITQVESDYGNIYRDGQKPNIFTDDTQLMVKTSDGSFTLVSDKTVINSKYGTFTIYENGDYIYKPNLNFNNVNKTDSIEYKLLDKSSGNSSSAKIKVKIDQGDFNISKEVSEEYNALVSAVDPISSEVTNGSINFLAPINLIGAERLVNTLSASIGKIFDFAAGTEGNGQLQLLPAQQTYQFEVGHGKTTDLLMKYNASSAVSVQSNLSTVLLKQVGDKWELVAKSSAGAGPSLLILGEKPSGELNVTGLTEGKYLILTSFDSGAGIATSVSASITTTEHSYSVDSNGDFLNTSAAVGNVFKNISDANLLDSDLTIKINGQSTKVEQKTTIHGVSGDLIISSDGSYVYKPYPNKNNIGTSEVFEFTYKTSEGVINTESLGINILSGKDYTQVAATPKEVSDSTYSIENLLNDSTDTLFNTDQEQKNSDDLSADASIFQVLSVNAKNENDDLGTYLDTNTVYSVNDIDKVDVSDLIADKNVDETIVSEFENVGDITTSTSTANILEHNERGEIFNPSSLLVLNNLTTEIASDKMLESNQVLF